MPHSSFAWLLIFDQLFQYATVMLMSHQMEGPCLYISETLKK